MSTLECFRTNAHRRAYLALLAVVTPLGFATKFYSGPGSVWISPQVSGSL